MIELDRKIDKTLLEWKESQFRKVLLLRGARQVGKTYAVRKLAKTFDNYVEVNFFETPEVGTFFEQGTLSPTKILNNLSIYYQKPIVAGKTLLFFDEVQSCPSVLTALRFFYEQIPELHLVVAGSLLEFVLDEIPSFGVGRVSSVFMYPLTIEEFFIASDHQLLVNEIKNSNSQSPLNSVLHKKAVELFRTYLLIGGLPEVVSAYCKNKDMFVCNRILDSILVSYQDDFVKYKEKVNVHKLLETLNAVGQQAGKKFNFSAVSQEENSSYGYNNCLELLVKAGIVRKVTHSSANGVPIGAELKLNKFKVYPFDIGIYNRLVGFNLNKYLLDDDITLVNSGAYAEIVVANELVSNTSPYQRTELYYWTREKAGSNAEVDFVVQLENEVVPIEVKAGTSGSMQSMYRFLLEKNKEIGIRMSLENFAEFKNSDDKRIKVFPLYAVGNLLKEA